MVYLASGHGPGGEDGHGSKSSNGNGDRDSGSGDDSDAKIRVGRDFQATVPGFIPKAGKRISIIDRILFLDGVKDSSSRRNYV